MFKSLQPGTIWWCPKILFIYLELMNSKSKLSKVKNISVHELNWVGHVAWKLDAVCQHQSAFNLPKSVCHQPANISPPPTCQNQSAISLPTSVRLQPAKIRLPSACQHQSAFSNAQWFDWFLNPPSRIWWWASINYLPPVWWCYNGAEMIIEQILKYPTNYYNTLNEI